MKYLFIVIALFLALGANAQSGTVKDLTSEFSLTTDTFTNTATVYMSVPARFSGDNNLTVSGKATNESGTTAGTAFIEWSLNGTDYATHPTADTMTVTDGAVHLWELTSTGAQKYRVNFTGSGTSVTIVEGQYNYK